MSVGLQEMAPRVKCTAQYELPTLILNGSSTITTCTQPQHQNQQQDQEQSLPHPFTFTIGEGGDEDAGHKVELDPWGALFFDYGVGQMACENRSATLSALLCVLELKL
eukprot:SAG11_NODE_571_length_8451_cov_34.938218_2_plen_108_part_00